MASPWVDFSYFTRVLTTTRVFDMLPLFEHDSCADLQ